MKNSDVVTLEQERKRLLAELLNFDGWAFGSLVTTQRKGNKRSYPVHYLSRSINGKNKITYISKRDFAEINIILQNGKKCRELLERISELSIQIIKNK
jgi:hypothetical protein